MEEDTIRIKKKYAYAGIILAVLALSFMAYSLGARNSRNSNSYPANQATAMGNSNPSSNSMDDHHKPIQLSSSGFFKDAVGKQAPDFELQDLNGNTVKLSDYRGKNVVLFFSEGSMCYPSCWNQISSLANDARFNGNDIVSFSIVVDSKSQWEQIMQKVPQMANSKILFDTDKKVSAQYDVMYTESSMHKGSYPGHTYFVIGKDGIIKYTYDDPNMAVRNDLIASEASKIA